MNLNELETQAKAATEAGFDAAAANLTAKVTLARKLAIAYERFRYVTEEQVQAFQTKLKETTRRPLDAEQARRLELQKIPHHPTRWEGATVIHDELIFTAMALYAGLPPTEVLTKVKEAKSMEVFDGFEVADIQPVATEIKLPDPIVFGRINGCTDRFFIADWGTDVNIGDLLGEHDG